MQLRPVDIACAHAVAGITVGMMARTGRRRPHRRLHQAAYAGACASGAWSALVEGDLRRRSSLVPAIVALAALPRTRAGSRGHVVVATVATIALLDARRRR